MHITNLVSDIYDVVRHKDGWFNEQLATDFSRELGLKLVETSKPRTEAPRLRLSQLGPQCPRALWHSIHTPELAEPFPPWALVKFTYGHILEALLISMAKSAGHEVLGEQDELTLDGVLGHRDCVLDGNVVDVKSCSSRQFQKYKDGSISLPGNDSFGYLDQLDGYVVASLDDPLVRNKSSGFILAIDKTLGHICLHEHHIREDSIRNRIRSYKEIVSRGISPGCTCGTVPDGKSGNIKLDVRASYSGFKYCCNPRLRTFIYASGPVYLTKVVRKPDVMEVDKYGKIVYT